MVSGFLIDISKLFFYHFFGYRTYFSFYFHKINSGFQRTKIQRYRILFFLDFF